MPLNDDLYWISFLPALIDRMNSDVKNNVTSVVSKYGITGSHAAYLVALKVQDGQTLIGLSNFLDLDPANTNRVIKTLKEKGFVDDDKKTESSKKYRIFLTETGQNVATIVIDSLTEMNNDYFKGVSYEEKQNLRNTMVKILENMKLDTDDKGLINEDTFYNYLHGTR